jgi:hypothetical protein
MLLGDPHLNGWGLLAKHVRIGKKAKSDPKYIPAGWTAGSALSLKIIVARW